jgi:hypothetical protein
VASLVILSDDHVLHGDDILREGIWGGADAG